MTDTTITSDSMVYVHYVLRDTNGEEIDASPDGAPLNYIHGHGQIVEGLEKALEGKGVGEKVRVMIPPEEGYGDRDPDRMVRVNRSQFEFEPEPGTLVRAEGPDGGSRPFVIAAVEEGHVILDGNHPLAGQDLDFEVTIVEIRPATAEELAEAAEEE